MSTTDENANFKPKVSHQFTLRQLSNITGEIFYQVFLNVWSMINSLHQNLI